MRLAMAEIAGETIWGAIEADCLVDLRVATGHTTLQAALQAQWRGAARQELRGPRHALGSIRLLAPLCATSKIFCVGVNYPGHAAELGRPMPAQPSIFVRVPSSVVGHQEPVLKPLETNAFDFEGELAVVIGRRARRVPAVRAREFVAGFTCFGDHSARDWQTHGSQVTPGKNFERSGACGPWIVSATALSTLGDCRLRTRVNGETRQQAALGEMIFAVERLIEYISTFTTLEPGDLICTGTPAGIGWVAQPPRYLEPGDLVEIEIDGIGTLANRVAVG